MICARFVCDDDVVWMTLTVGAEAIALPPTCFALATFAPAIA